MENADGLDFYRSPSGVYVGCFGIACGRQAGTISTVTIVAPFKYLMLLNLKSGVVAIHTAAPMTQFATISTGAPLEAVIAGHSGA